MHLLNPTTIYDNKTRLTHHQNLQ